PETATDTDFDSVQSVVAHEYFHNWTGNRITCRDWFQLSLKEGLTVFRDQEFSADMGSAAVWRIRNVNLLRSHQFAEDAGPTAHPVRPDSYMEINNFYTLTIYEKGSEIIRMLQVRLGRDGFRRGMDCYFQRHDGQAVTVEDLVSALGHGGGQDLSPFMAWYDRPGTPVVEARGSFDAQREVYHLQLRQKPSDNPALPRTLSPLPIPVSMGLLARDGQACALHCPELPGPVGTQAVLMLDTWEHTWSFSGLDSAPVPSLLRDFSAPVRLEIPLDEADLALLWAHDDNLFNRWEAGQRLGLGLLIAMTGAMVEGREPPAPPPVYLEALGHVLARHAQDPALTAQAITPPGEEMVLDRMRPAAPVAIAQARRRLFGHLAQAHESVLRLLHAQLNAEAGERQDSLAAGQRALANQCLAFLLALGGEDVLALAHGQFFRASGMTNRIGALQPLVHWHPDAPAARECLAEYRRRWENNALVMDKWLTIQATIPRADTLQRVERLMGDPVFSMRNPNRVRALIGAFSRNLPAFHQPSGAGYAFYAERIMELDRSNPQVAARLLAPLTRWRGLEPVCSRAMRSQLERVMSQPALSVNCQEIAAKGLAAGAA
ncbi:MAG: DUF3458 domain-containing protein, partial [Magnetococcus sp. WYHC-3]